eukprot:Skav200844  [mRNA]  locus=scaffold2131:137635:146164:- [translate_table: standard]
MAPGQQVTAAMGELPTDLFVYKQIVLPERRGQYGHRSSGAFDYKMVDQLLPEGQTPGLDLRKVVLPQGISSAGELGTIRGSMIQANFPTSGSVSIPAKTQAAIDIRPVLSGSRRLATPSSWGGSSAPVMLPRSMEGRAVTK